MDDPSTFCKHCKELLKKTMLQLRTFISSTSNQTFANFEEDSKHEIF